jgi:hypothetical protein
VSRFIEPFEPVTSIRAGGSIILAEVVKQLEQQRLSTYDVNPKTS